MQVAVSGALWILWDNHVWYVFDCVYVYAESRTVRVTASGSNPRNACYLVVNAAVLVSALICTVRP